MRGYERSYSGIEAPEQNAAGYEQVTILALALIASISVISWVSKVVHEHLNALDTATTVVAKKTDYKEKPSSNPPASKVPGARR